MLKKNAKITAIFASLLLATSVMAGCAQSGPATQAGNAKDALIVATAYDAKSLDPHAVNDVASSNVMAQIYSTLVQLNDKGEVVPMLAESFEQVDDVTYKFVLKKGVKFHNGEELKAGDVKFTLTRAAESATVSHIFGDIDTTKFEITDDYNLVVKLKNPVTGFLAGLVHTGGNILNEKAVKEAGDGYAMKPVGTGPFKFVSWTKGDKVELERFADFYAYLPEKKPQN